MLLEDEALLVLYVRSELFSPLRMLLMLISDHPFPFIEVKLSLYLIAV